MQQNIWAENVCVYVWNQLGNYGVKISTAKMERCFASVSSPYGYAVVPVKLFWLWAEEFADLPDSSSGRMPDCVLHNCAIIQRGGEDTMRITDDYIKEHRHGGVEVSFDASELQCSIKLLMALCRNHQTKGEYWPKEEIF